MKSLIISFFAVILVFSLFFDDNKQQNDSYKFGLNSSLNVQSKVMEDSEVDSTKVLIAFKESDSLKETL